MRQPDAQVKSVASELGYKSPARFSRAFKAWHGRPPRTAMVDQRLTPGDPAARPARTAYNPATCQPLR
ncbi:MAG: helix-turn-helix transcriptional regulator [Lentisphaerae bacterium]|nr:helix-turn-helix transcriptional regulator [Lentisphaerota bacterium]